MQMQGGPLDGWVCFLPCVESLLVQGGLLDDGVMVSAVRGINIYVGRDALIPPLPGDVLYRAGDAYRMCPCDRGADGEP